MLKPTLMADLMATRNLCDNGTKRGLIHVRRQPNLEAVLCGRKIKITRSLFNDPRDYFLQWHGWFCQNCLNALRREDDCWILSQKENADALSAKRG